jgi:hypothetical protein
MAMLGRSEHRLFRGGEPPLPLAATESKSIELSLSRHARLLRLQFRLQRRHQCISFLPVILICNSQLRPAMTPPSTGKIVPVIQQL